MTNQYIREMRKDFNHWQSPFKYGQSMAHDIKAIGERIEDWVILEVRGIEYTYPLEGVSVPAVS